MKIHKTLKIVVICGGPSKEAEVSRSTAQGIVKALQENYSQVRLVELDNQIDKHLRELTPDVVFPAVHGKWGEDGNLQGLLNIMGLPFVGSDMEANVLAMDKILSKQVFLLHRLPVANYRIVTQNSQLELQAQEIIATLGNAVVIKPACEGSGLGVSFAHNVEEALKGLELALSFGPRALVETKITGAEITAAILDCEKTEVLPVIEIKTPPGTWYDYEHRYTPGLSEHVIPAQLPREQYKRVQEVALIAHQALGCRDLSRADFVVPSQGEPILLEVNSLPGMTPTSLFPDAAKAVGISFPELVSLLIERAAARSNNKPAMHGIQA
jgi:D-alanine-D-alanine ligase